MGEGADGVEGVVEKVRIELVAEDFKSGFFFAELLVGLLQKVFVCQKRN